MMSVLRQIVAALNAIPKEIKAMATDLKTAVSDLTAAVKAITTDSSDEITRITTELNDLKAKVTQGALDNQAIADTIEGHVAALTAVSDSIKSFEPPAVVVPPDVPPPTE